MKSTNRAETYYYCHRFSNGRNRSVLGNFRNRVTFVLEVFFVTFLMAITESMLGYLGKAGLLCICVSAPYPHIHEVDV
jgi:hypothetical protein